MRGLGWVDMKTDINFQMTRNEANFFMHHDKVKNITEVVEL